MKVPRALGWIGGWLGSIVLVALGMVADAEAAPRLVLECGEVDLGELLQGEQATAEFPFRNEGNDTLVLQEPRAWCGCEAELVGGPEFGPGKEGSIRVTFDSGERVGRFQRSVILLGNDPEHPETSLVLLGSVREVLKAEPDLLALPEIHQGTGASGEIRLLQQADGPFEILGWESSHPAVTVLPEPLEEGTPGYRLRIDVADTLPAGPLQEHLTIRTSCPGRPTLRIPVLGRVLERIRAEPAWCSFRVTGPGDRRSRTVTLRSSGTEPLEILAVEPSAAFLTARLVSPGKGGSQELGIDLSGAAPPGTTRASILVRTSDPQQPELTIPVLVHRRVVQSRDASVPEEPAAAERR